MTRAGRDTVILLIDHQVGPLWELDCITARRRTVELAAGAHRVGLPRIVTTIAPEEHGPLIPELATLCMSDPFILRTDENAWDDRDVRRIVGATGHRRIIVAGGDIERSVIPCALAARRDGFQVDVVMDASGPCTSGVLARLLDGGVNLTSVKRILTEFFAEWTRETCLAAV